MKKAVEPVWRSSNVTVHALERAVTESGYPKVSTWIQDTPDFFGKLKGIKEFHREGRKEALAAVAEALKLLCEAKGLETEPRQPEPLYAEPIERSLDRERAQARRATRS